MKLFAVLCVFCVFSFIGNVGHAQLTSEQLRTMQNIKIQQEVYRERLQKAEKAGASLFGTDERISAESNQLGGTVRGKSANEFEVGDWGYSEKIFEVLDIVSKSEVLILAIGKNSEPMLIRGLNTDKVTDGVEFVLRRPFTISGTYKYETVDGGSNTVLVLDTIKVEERLKEAEAAAEKARAAAEEALYRTWTVAGKDMEAKYTSFDSGKVTLTLKDQTTSVVSIADLSKDDKAIVAKERKQAAASKAEADKQERMRAAAAKAEAEKQERARKRNSTNKQ